MVNFGIKNFFRKLCSFITLFRKNQSRMLLRIFTDKYRNLRSIQILEIKPKNKNLATFIIRSYYSGRSKNKFIRKNVNLDSHHC